MSKLKRVLAVAAAAAAIAGAVPVTAGASAEVAVGPCQARSLVQGVKEWYQEVLVTGEAHVAGAIDVALTCGVVRYGETVDRVSEQRPGPVAVLADVVSVHASSSISSCYTLRVTYIDHSTYKNTCP